MKKVVLCIMISFSSFLVFASNSDVVIAMVDQRDPNNGSKQSLQNLLTHIKKDDDPRSMMLPTHEKTMALVHASTLQDRLGNAGARRAKIISELQQMNDVDERAQVRVFAQSMKRVGDLYDARRKRRQRDCRKGLLCGCLCGSFTTAALAVIAFGSWMITSGGEYTVSS